jgi:hypothetical protein
MSLHGRMPAGLRPSSLDAVACLYVDTLWQTRLDWWRDLPAGKSIDVFLSRAQEEYHMVRPEK